MNPIERSRRRRQHRAILHLTVAGASVLGTAAFVVPRVQEHRAEIGAFDRALAREVEPLRNAVEWGLFRGEGMARLEAAERELSATADPNPLAYGFERDLAERVKSEARGEVIRVDRSDPVRITQNGIAMYATPVEVAARIPAESLHKVVATLAGGARPGMITGLRIERQAGTMHFEIVATLHVLHATDRMPILTE